MKDNWLSRHKATNPQVCSGENQEPVRFASKNPQKCQKLAAQCTSGTVRGSLQGMVQNKKDWVIAVWETVSSLDAFLNSTQLGNCLVRLPPDRRIEGHFEKGPRSGGWPACLKAYVYSLEGIRTRSLPVKEENRVSLGNKPSLYPYTQQAPPTCFEILTDEQITKEHPALKEKL